MKLAAFSLTLLLHGIALFGLDTTLREGTEPARLVAMQPPRIVITAPREDTVVAAGANNFF